MNLHLINTVILAMMLNAGSSDIDFFPKQLTREIKKISGINKPVSTEIQTFKGITIDTSQGKFLKYHSALPVAYSYAGRVFTCRAEGCQAKRDHPVNEKSSEYFDYFILYDSTASILSVHVYNYEATHGQEISVKSWLNQFAGFNGDKELIVGKDIDAISGATVSVHSISDDIVQKTNLLREYLK